MLSTAFFSLCFAFAQASERTTARKGPIELTLEVASTTIHRGQAIWVAVEIKNVGKKPISLIDELFSDRARDIALAHGKASHGIGIHFELKGPDGLELNLGYPELPHECLPFNRRYDDPPTKKFIVTDAEGDAADHYFKQLKPQESVRTRDWLFEPMDSRSCETAPRENPNAGTGLQELGVYTLEKLGKYKLRVIYANELSPVLRAMGNKVEPEDVNVTTGWITIHLRD